MYCPKCGTQNADAASFCRACGANISLVPQALTGQLPETQAAGRPDEYRGSRRGRHRGEREPSLSKAVSNIFMGIGFILVALCVKSFMPGGFTWWFWMLIPAFAMLGGGVAEYLRLKQQGAPRQLPGAAYVPPSAPPAVPPPARAGSTLPPRDTSEFYAPPAGVTENTTRLLERDEPRGAPAEQPEER